jgi:peptidoglycan-associated lipoprotein
MAEGAPGERLSTLSYGEERPADPRRSEGAWQQNRRVELVY